MKAFWLLIVALCFNLALAWSTGIFGTEWEERVRAAPDSQGYMALASYFAGRGDAPDPDTILLRPPLYGLLLASQFASPALLIALQVTLALFSVLLMARTLERLGCAPKIVLLGTTLYGLLPTAHLVAYFALTESLTLFLITLGLYFGAGILREDRDRDWCGAIVCAGLCLLVKQVALPVYALLWLGYAIRKRRLARLIPLLLPVVVQLSYTRALAGRASMGATGAINFERRFFPAVYGTAEHGRFIDEFSEEAEAARKLYPTLADQERYVLAHLPSALKTYTDIFWNENVRAGSSFARIFPGFAGGFVFELSRVLNRLILILAVGGLIGAEWRRRRSRAAYLYFLVGLTFLVGAPLTYWQGDRLLLMALPAFIVAAMLPLRTGSLACS